MNEIWKKIVGTEYYEVSNLGNVRSCDKPMAKGRTLRPWTTKDNYSMVGLYIEGKRKCMTIHRLVALTFIPNPENKPCVNHKNGNKMDNRVENLEWVTYQENSRHSIDNKLQVNKKGEQHSCSLLTESQAQEILDSTNTGVSLAKKFGVSQSTVSSIRKGRNWGHLIKNGISSKDSEPK